MDTLQLNINHVWILVATVLVFFMQAGFCALEIGLTRQKNSINVAMKNITDFMVGTLFFALIGFPLMFGLSKSGIIGTSNFFFEGIGSTEWDWAFLLFQIAFAGTAATIVSGAIAERAKFSGYVIATIIITTLIYPIFGHWAWGSLWTGETSGWLESLGFMDFAGSTVVHSIGAWLALAAVLILGPRIGKYDGTSPNKFEGNNPILATLGMLLLWFGWFGFNSGSTTVGDESIAIIALNTQLAAVAGGTAAMVYSWIKDKKPRLDSVINGILGGLVSVTAGCNVLTPLGSIAIGLIGGALTIIALKAIDEKLKIDDAVGAISVHGVSGAWGTIGLVFFSPASSLATGNVWSQLGVQLIGVGTAFVWAFAVGFIVFKTMNHFNMLRAEKNNELIGLDITEHGEQLSIINSLNELKADIEEMKTVKFKD